MKKIEDVNGLDALEFFSDKSGKKWRIIKTLYRQSVTREDGIHVYSDDGLIKVMRYDGRELHLQPEE